MLFNHLVVSNSATPWTAACQASLSFTSSRSLLTVMSIESVMLSNHLVLCCPFSSCLQSFPASGSFLMSRLFSKSSLSIQSSNSIPGYIPKENENTNSKRHMHLSVHKSIIYSSSDGSNLSVHRQMN